MKKYEIVKEHKEFDDILSNGSYYKNNYYIIYNKDSNYNFPRFGIAAGKKLGNAVIRNKIKRQVRMIISSNKNLFKNNKDYIIMIRKGCLESTFQNRLEKLEKKLKENI